jgi:hypothetical protein
MSENMRKKIFKLTAKAEAGDRFRILADALAKPHKTVNRGLS